MKFAEALDRLREEGIDAEVLEALKQKLNQLADLLEDTAQAHRDNAATIRPFNAVIADGIDGLADEVALAAQKVRDL